MQIDKRQVVELLIARGEQTRVYEADQDLPDPVDTVEHREVLTRLGLAPDDLEAALGNGGPGGEVGGLLES
jgi:hypothetical protein